jgi:hypothetical protein
MVRIMEKENKIVTVEFWVGFDSKILMSSDFIFF